MSDLDVELGSWKDLNTLKQGELNEIDNQNVNQKEFDIFNDEDASGILKEGNKSLKSNNYSGDSLIIQLNNKIKYATISQSVFNMSATMIGAGILTLSYVMRLSGLGFGIVFIIAGALTYVWCLTLLNEYHAHSRNKSKNFGEICHYLGGKPMGYFFEISMIIQLFGTIALYQMIALDLINKVLLELGFSEQFVNSSATRDIQVITIAVFICYPLCVQETLKALSYASLFSIITMGITAIVLLIEMPFYFKQNYSSHKLSYFIFNWDALDAFAITFFAYSCDQTFFNILGDLKDNTPIRMQKVLRITLFINFCFFFIVALSGYLSTFDETPKVVITRTNLEHFGNRDYFNMIAIIGVIVTIVISIPINYVPLRRSLFNIFYSNSKIIKTPEQVEKNELMTIFTLSSTTIVTIFFPKIRSMLSILGGFAATNTDYIIPVLIYILGTPGALSEHKKVFSCIYAFLLAFFGYTAVSFTIYRIYTGTAQ